MTSNVGKDDNKDYEGKVHSTGVPGEVRRTTPIMKYFEYQHLPPRLRMVSQRCAELAEVMDTALPDGPEKSAGLRKLLEAKDCFVRAALEQTK